MKHRKGHIPWSKGKKYKQRLPRTEEHKNKIRIALKNRVIPETIRERMSLGCLGRQISIATRFKLSDANRGEKSYLWRGGITKTRYKIRRSIEYRLWREAIFARDNWTCQNCMKRGIYIHAHHIKSFAKYPELRYAIDNGLTLCKKCHSKKHEDINLFRTRQKDKLSKPLSFVDLG